MCSRHEIAEILQRLELNTNQSFIQSINQIINQSIDHCKIISLIWSILMGHDLYILKCMCPSVLTEIDKKNTSRCILIIRCDTKAYISEKNS